MRYYLLYSAVLFCRDCRDCRPGLVVAFLRIILLTFQMESAPRTRTQLDNDLALKGRF